MCFVYPDSSLVLDACAESSVGQPAKRPSALPTLAMLGSALNLVVPPSQSPGTELEGRAGLVHHFLRPETHPHRLVRDLARKLRFLLVAGDGGCARRSRLGKEKDGVLNRSLRVFLVDDMSGRD